MVLNYKQVVYKILNLPNKVQKAFNHFWEEKWMTSSIKCIIMIKKSTLFAYKYLESYQCFTIVTK